MENISKKTLIIIRHCHRDKSMGRRFDNGLSEKGLRQSLLLCEMVGPRVSGLSPMYLTSPKKRCFESLVPLADLSGQKITISPLLDEQADSENSQQFLSRVEDFETWWQNLAPAHLIICSHGDWIPAFLGRMFGESLQLKKGGWVWLERKLKTNALKMVHRLKD